jgi:hypothetical protein
MKRSQLFSEGNIIPSIYVILLLLKKTKKKIKKKMRVNCPAHPENLDFLKERLETRVLNQSWSNYGGLKKAHAVIGISDSDTCKSSTFILHIYIYIYIYASMQLSNS